MQIRSLFYTREGIKKSEEGETRKNPPMRLINYEIYVCEKKLKILLILTFIII